ncbi:uncharacterized protein LOC110022960 [Phalaenopsis equestris]|uniref:uncharacterized protein LOC110022960 n=1 Tax=Phalaenopsis equestris TaxID=78828 RepID=UPI0009E5EF0E|nr:uncharacterized protein LOC110022960 [Phalaenopsis equestris]
MKSQPLGRPRSVRAPRANNAVAIDDLPALAPSPFSKEQLDLLNKLIGKPPDLAVLDPINGLLAHQCTFHYAFTVNLGSFDQWIINFGTSHHMTGDVSLLYDYMSCGDNFTIRVPDGSVFKVIGLGSVRITQNILLRMRTQTTIDNAEMCSSLYVFYDLFGGGAWRRISFLCGQRVEAITIRQWRSSPHSTPLSKNLEISCNVTYSNWYRFQRVAAQSWWAPPRQIHSCRRDKGSKSDGGKRFAVTAAYIEKERPEKETTLAIISTTGGFLDVSVINIRVNDARSMNYHLILRDHKFHSEPIDFDEKKESSRGGLVGAVVKTLVFEPFEKAFQVLENILISLHIGEAKVDKLVYVGKASKSEKLREAANKSFPHAGEWEGIDDPEEVAAHGAAFLSYDDKRLPVSLPGSIADVGP